MRSHTCCVLYASSTYRLAVVLIVSMSLLEFAIYSDRHSRLIHTLSLPDPSSVRSCANMAMPSQRIAYKIDSSSPSAGSIPSNRLDRAEIRIASRSLRVPMRIPTTQRQTRAKRKEVNGVSSLLAHFPQFTFRVSAFSASVLAFNSC